MPLSELSCDLIFSKDDRKYDAHHNILENILQSNENISRESISACSLIQ